MKNDYFVSLLVVIVLLPFVVEAQTCNFRVLRSTPDSRFSLIGDGTVKDNQTGLIWMRCSLGQSWDGNNNCIGGSAKFTWPAALSAAENQSFGGYNDWRLPNIKELSSIIEEGCFDPAINTTIFPATPADFYWSSSPFKNGAGTLGSHASIVWFFTGKSDALAKNSSNNVRLVRSGL